jgi:sec-independent protein translocase protein TatA
MIFAKPWADALIVLLVILLFFGPKRLPSLGRSLGEGMREFKDSITGKSGSHDEEDERPAVSETSVAPAEPPPTPVPPPPAATREPAPPAAAPPPEAAAPPPPVASSERRS